jgi:hypothetical protein
MTSKSYQEMKAKLFSKFINLKISRGDLPLTDVEQVGELLESLDVFLLAHRWVFSLATRADPASSEAIRGSGDMAMSAIETSLAVLKEASSLAQHIPYISPVAGLLLQALTMRGESRSTAFRAVLYLNSTFNRRRNSTRANGYM